jgi:hypothetical protein
MGIHTLNSKISVLNKPPHTLHINPVKPRRTISRLIIISKAMAPVRLHSSLTVQRLDNNHTLHTPPGMDSIMQLLKVAQALDLERRNLLSHPLPQCLRPMATFSIQQPLGLLPPPPERLLKRLLSLTRWLLLLELILRLPAQLPHYLFILELRNL